MSSNEEETKIITYKELQLHNKPGDYWVLIEKYVYNVTPYLTEHPGGDDILINHSGKDATQKFLSIDHTEYAISIRNSFRMGKIEEGPIPEECKAPKVIVSFNKLISNDVLKQHNSSKDCWVSIDGFVYDCTHFLDDHPGGGGKITSRAGTDATRSFNNVGHSPHAHDLMKSMCVGKLFNKKNDNFNLFTSPQILGVIILSFAIFIFYKFFI